MKRKTTAGGTCLVAGLLLSTACASGSGSGSEGGTPAPAADAAATVAMGESIFMGKGNCFTCHGPTGGGTLLAPDLTDDEWLIADGTLASIVRVVTTGVPQPTTSDQPMPPRGDGVLSDAEIEAVAQYVLTLRRAP